MVVQVLVKTFGPAMGFRSFRYYWFGTLASVIGFQILAFSQFWIIHELTGSALYLGYVGVANAIPAMALNLFGGVLADKVEYQKWDVCWAQVQWVKTKLFTLQAIEKVRAKPSISSREMSHFSALSSAPRNWETSWVP